MLLAEQRTVALRGSRSSQQGQSRAGEAAATLGVARVAAMSLATLHIRAGKMGVSFTVELPLRRDPRASSVKVAGDFRKALKRAFELSRTRDVSHAVLQAGAGRFEVVRLMVNRNSGSPLIDGMGVDGAIEGVRLRKVSGSLAGIAGASGSWDLRSAAQVTIPQHPIT